MTIEVQRIEPEQYRITFTVPDDVHDGPVSVVGSFNDWSPYAHPLLAMAGAARSVSVTVKSGADVHFRYLGFDGVWFDDPDADEVTSTGSVIRLAQHPGQATDTAESAAAVPDGPATITPELDSAKPVAAKATPRARKSRQSRSKKPAP